MPHIEKPVPGSFCWIELSTTDQNGAKSFYNSLLQWTAVDQPMGPGEFYTMFQIEGKNAGAEFDMLPVTIERVGCLANMADPQGAVSSIFTPAPRS